MSRGAGAGAVVDDQMRFRRAAAVVELTGPMVVGAVDAGSPRDTDLRPDPC